MEVSVNVVIDSPKARVWQVITDIDNAVNFISAIIDLEVLERPADGLVGLKWRETREIFGKEADETMWITDSEPEVYYQTRAENHGAVYISRLSLREENDQTTLTMSFSGEAETWFAKLMSLVMSAFMKNSMVKMLQQDLDDIKNYIENQSVKSLETTSSVF